MFYYQAEGPPDKLLLEKLQTEIVALKEKNAALNEKNAALKEQNFALQTEIAVLKEENAGLRTENSAIKSKIGAVEVSGIKNTSQQSTCRFLLRFCLIYVQCVRLILFSFLPVLSCNRKKLMGKFR